MAEAMSEALRNVAIANVLFSVNLYKSLCNSEENIIISPVSAQCILALACLGAEGATAEEMRTVLQLPNDSQLIQNGFLELMSTMKGNDNMILNMANKIFSEVNFPIKPEFKNISRNFLAEAEEVNFSSGYEEARLAINKWVEENTNQKIKNLFQEGILNELTRLVLVNAIYFKGKWKLPFKPSDTCTEPFHLSTSESKDVEMMHIKKKFHYGDFEELKMKILELPYEGDLVSMVVFLPHDVDGLTELENNLNKMDIFDLLKQTHQVEVNVALPKFKIERTTDLNEILQKMGMTTMFNDQKADFSGISRDLYVSKVLQKAFIEVNEEGSEAAAATGKALLLKKKMTIPKHFTADHPFLFLLVNNIRKILLFLGRIKKMWYGVYVENNVIDNTKTIHS